MFERTQNIVEMDKNAITIAHGALLEKYYLSFRNKNHDLIVAGFDPTSYKFFVDIYDAKHEYNRFASANPRSVALEYYMAAESPMQVIRSALHSVSKNIRIK